MADLTTLASANQWLGLPTPNLATDALVSDLITQASAAILNAMTRDIALTTYVETRNGMGGRRMVVMQTPIVSVSSLVINGATIQARPALGPAQSSPGGGYIFDDSSIMLTAGYEFCSGYGNVVISYTAGYATTPSDLVFACNDTVADWFKYRDRVGKTSEGIEGQTISFTNLPIPVRAMGIINKRNSVAPVY